MKISDNRVVVRGDKTPIIFEPVDGDHTGRKLKFGVKADRSITGTKLIEKSNTLAGGSSLELSASFDAATQKTTITVYLLPVNTRALDFTDEAKNYYYDVTSEAVGDATDTETILLGRLRIIADIQTPYDDNSEVIDPPLSSDWNSLLTFLLTGNIDENTVAFDMDEMNVIVDIDEGNLG